MNSRDLGSRVPPGDGAEKVDRRTVGADAPATGSARVVIGMAALNLGVLSFVLWALVSRERDGLLLLATLFGAAFLWAVGAYRASFWTR